MTIWYTIGGAAMLILGLLVWLLFLGASAFRAGFGSEPIPAYLYLIPAAITFGGPALLWFVLPRRRRSKRGAR